MRRSVEYGSGATPLALIIADDPRAASDAQQAMALAGGEFRGRSDWPGALAGRFDHTGPIELVAVEMQGVAPDMLAAVLPRLAMLRDDPGTYIVAALDVDQIDQIAGTLLGERVELLCAPSLADRAAAFTIALAGSSRNVLHDRSSDSGSQLRQLNEEVARISRVLARLAAEEKRPGGVADRKNDYAPPPGAPGEKTVTASDIRRAIRTRRMRDQFFSDGLFEDPAWDMLLDLYAAELEGAQVSVSSLCIAAAVAPTTALRWIARMTEAGLFVRQPDPFDRRRAFLRLSTDARSTMERYFAALRQSGLEPM